MDVKLQCRSCLKNCLDDGLEMTDSRNKFEGLTILEVFLECTRVSLVDDLPKFLCHLCFLRLKDAFSFIRQCMETNEKISALFEEQEILIENETVLSQDENKDWMGNACESIEYLEDEEEFIKDDINYPEYNEEPEKKYNPKINYEPESTETVVPVPPIPEPNWKAKKNKYVGYLCPSPLCRAYCGTKPGHLGRHLKQNEGKSDHLYTCAHCSSKFTRRNHLFAHALQLHKEYQCDICTEVFSGERALVSHKRKFHKIVDTSVACTICSKILSSKKVLLKHMIAKHGIGGEQKVFTCPDCPRTFKTNTGLIYHKRTHTGEKPFCCEICGKSFIQVANLQFHMSTHSDEKNFQCDICSLKVKHAYTLKEHRQIHFTPSNIKCPICCQSFKFEKYLKSHMSVHKSDKDEVCQTCGMAFKNVRNLRAHMKKHGDPEHKCHLCEKSYYRKGELVEHISAMHEQNRMYVCSFPNCGKSYLRKPHLNHHVRTAHSNVEKGQQQLPPTLELKLDVN